MDAMSVVISMLSVLTCFNPRARDGRDGIKTGAKAVKTVSIHAPVMDAIW